METYIDRLRVEAKELTERAVKLNSAIVEHKIPDMALPINRVQSTVMQNYMIVLDRKLGIGGHSFDFGLAKEFLVNGFAVTRKGWNGKGIFVVKQVPAEIGLDIIPNMQSLPQIAKDKLVAAGTSIKYNNQMLIIKEDGNADSWVPSSSDIFAEDWIIV